MFWTLINNPLARLGGLILITLALIGWVYWAGVSDAKRDQKDKDTQEYIDTTERMNEVPRSNTRDDALNILRNMGDLR